MVGQQTKADDVAAGIMRAIEQAAHQMAEEVLAIGPFAASLIAQRYGVEHALVMEQLESMPNEMVQLLSSPQGWTALGFWSAEGLGVDARAAVMPTIH